MKKIFCQLSVFAVVSVLLVPTVQAAEFLKPLDRQEQSFVVAKEESHKNLYVAAPNLSVEGGVKGDLVAAGGMVSLEGPVEQDVILAGGNLFLNGSVGGDARVAGGNVNISGPVGGDLVVAGGNITISEKSGVGGDLVVAGGNVQVNAPVKGHIRFVGGNLSINSKVEGLVKATASEKLTFGPKAEILGKVYFRGVTPAIVKDGAKVSGIEYNKLERPGFRGVKYLFTLAFLIKLLAWMLVGWLAFKFFNKPTREFFSGFESNFWKNLGLGLVWLIALPIVLLLLLISAVGYYLAMLGVIVYVLAMMVSAILSALVLGYLVVKRLSKPTEEIKSWQVVVIGVVLWFVILLIPVLGFIFLAVMFLASFGSLISQVKSAIKSN